MNKRILAAVLAAALCLAAAVPALANNVFLFTEKTLTLYEGETAQTALRREGVYEGDGEITYTSGNPAVATVSETGEVTATGKGKTTVTAVLRRDGRQAGRAQLSVTVIRAVQKVTLNTNNLAVYEPEDPVIAGLMRESTEHRVIVLPAGATALLNVTCTPEDATNRRIAYATSDAGIAKLAGERSLKAVQRGECDLVISSVQDPQVTETFHVLVTQPVKKVEVSAPVKKVDVGSGLQLTALCSPEDASIKKVTWTSKNPTVASVDENGYVTGLKRGNATISASATDGSRVTGGIYLTVTQPVTDIVFDSQEIPVIVGRTAQAKVKVLPTDASDKTLVWSSSDESVATVKGGQIRGVKAGSCVVTAASKANPEVAVEVRVTVSQLVTKIVNVNAAEELSLRVGEETELVWEVQPSDATNKGLTFKSVHPKVVKVNEGGIATAVGRGTGTIVATAVDGSRRQGTVKIKVIQPVTGVSMKKALYYVQRGGNTTVRAVVEPKNANNQKVYWSVENESVATIRENGTSTGRVHGVAKGRTMISAFTEDGGFIANARIRVGNFNEAVLVEELYVNKKNEIRISLRNMSNDITLENVFYTIECYDMNGDPMVCNKDGKSTSFDGSYPFGLAPLDRSSHGCFRFKNYVIDQPLGGVVMTVTGWRDTDGYTWTIPESERIRTQWDRVFLHQ